MRAFVLSGGAALGSVQVGMLHALWERGVEPDIIIGASAGAINATYLAGSPSLAGIEALDKVWCDIRRNHVFPTRPLLGLTGFLGRSSHLVPNHGLRKILAARLAINNLEDAAIPVHVVVTDLLTGNDHTLTTGDAVTAVTASAAIPGVFPPVTIDGATYVDGGVANNTPISHAVDAGADEIWVLPVGYACALPKPPTSALGVALQALGLLVHSRLIHDIARYGDQVDLHVVPPLCPLAVGPTDFSRARRLIDDARRSTESWLDDPTPITLQLHHHA